jgi:hypothetical protein
VSSRSACFDVGRQVDARELLAQVLRLLGRLVELAELLLDRLELLAQDVLALALVDLGLDLGLDLRADGDDLELAGQRLDELAQPGADVHLLEELLLLLGLEAQGARDQVRQRGRVVDVGDGELELLGQVGHLLDDPRERLLDVAHERGELGRLDLHEVGQLGDPRDEVRRLAHVLLQAHALGALHEDPQGAVGHLEHAGDGAHDADVVQGVGARGLELGSREATMTSMRSPARMSLMSCTLRSWPTASGVNASGSGTVSRSGQDRQLRGHAALAADLDGARRVAVRGW